MPQQSTSFFTRLLAVTGLLALLQIWRMVSPEAACLPAAFFLLALWITLVLSAYEWAVVRRLGFIAQYLRPDGVIARWLSRRTLLLLWHAAKALPAALILLTAATSLTNHQWILMALDAYLLVVLVSAGEKLLHNELADRYLQPLVRVWMHRINAVLLWIALLAISFYLPHADYRGLGWEAAAQSGALGVNVGCDVVAVFARGAAVGESLAWWAAQNLLHDLGTPQLLMAWLVFLGAFGVSFLIAWIYSRMLVGILSRPWRVTAPETRGTDPPK